MFIADSAVCQYQVFAALPLASRRLLAGTIIVAFNPEAYTVDVFSVDGHGQVSAKAVSIPTS